MAIYCDSTNPGFHERTVIVLRGIVIPIIVWVILAIGAAVSLVISVQSVLQILTTVGWGFVIGGIIVGCILLFLLGEKLIAFIRYLENRKQS
jgi:predicted membrane chloride channel (bestrophin family)